MASVLLYQSERESNDEALEELVIQPKPPSQGCLEQDVSEWYATQFDIQYEMLQL